MSDMQSKMDFVGVVGGMIISLSLVPQLYKTYRMKNATNISYTYQTIYIVGCTMINIYALYTRIWIIYVPCLVEQVLIVTLTLMKVRYDGIRGNHHNLNENSD